MVNAPVAAVKPKEAQFFATKSHILVDQGLPVTSGTAKYGLLVGQGLLVPSGTTDHGPLVGQDLLIPSSTADHGPLVGQDLPNSQVQLIMVPWWVRTS